MPEKCVCSVAMDKFVWTYKDTDGEWQVFNDVDQAALETAFAAPEGPPVRVLAGRSDAFLTLRIIKTVYDPTPADLPIRRASWFADGIPFSEPDALAITEWAATEASKTKHLMVGDRKIYRSSSESATILMAGQNLLSVSRSVVRFGEIGCDVSVPPSNGDDPNQPCGHLVIAVHGIGESLWSRKAFSLKPFEISCSAFRRLVNELPEPAGRTEVLHVNWYHILANSIHSKRISDITLPTIPLMRQLANEALSDVLFYLNHEHHDLIVSHVSSRIVEILALFKQRNPTFAGKISFLGHSLGSVILFDVLHLAKLPEEIKVDNLFLLGSPLGMILTARSQSDFLPLRNCRRIFNLFQPNDPVAYRVEPYLVPVMKGLEPALVPYHKTGGLATTTQVKNTASSIMGLFTNDDQSTVMERITQVVKGPPSPKPDTPLGLGVQLIQAVNDGARIDWSLQQGFLPGATEYADALVAHVSYFDHKDVAKFVHDKASL